MLEQLTEKELCDAIRRVHSYSENTVKSIKACLDDTYRGRYNSKLASKIAKAVLAGE